MKIERKYSERLPGVWVYVFHDDGDEMAYSALDIQEWDHLDRPRGYIHSVRTLEPYQRQGIATLMLKELIAAAEEFGCEDVRLHVYSTNEPAQRLYYKHGFRPEDGQEGPYCFSNGACHLVRPVWGGES